MSKEPSDSPIIKEIDTWLELKESRHLKVLFRIFDNAFANGSFNDIISPFNQIF